VLRGSYCTAGGVSNVLPVDVSIPGCPPRPQALIHGLLLAMDRMEQKLHATAVSVER
jgi:hydrogenase-4 component I/formate hydrogenlyase subunit 7